MNKIRFSEDYEKLPEVWKGTQAKLIGIFESNTTYLKNTMPSFVIYDTKYRNKNECYGLVPDTPVIILMFIHYNNGKPFTTIRKNTEFNFNYYNDRLGQTFVLEKSKSENVCL